MKINKITLIVLISFIGISLQAQSWTNKITSLYPADNQIRISQTDSLIINFENPVATLSGNLVIYDEEGRLFESISLSSGNVSGSGSNQIVVKPSKKFEKIYSYYINISADAFGANYPGISDNKSWNFSRYDYLKEMVSSDSAGNDYKIYVSYPEDYDTSRTEPYPVVYMLDGNWIDDLSTASSSGMFMMVQDYWKTGNVPQVVTVAIGYPSTGNPGELRQRDFLFDNASDDFFSFIKHELVPYIDTSYHVSDSNRTFLGYSYGGVFAFSVAVQFDTTENRLFKNVMSGDPSLWYYDENDNYKTHFDFEREYFQKTDSLPINLFMGTGDTNTTNARFVHAMEDSLNSRNYKGFNLKVNTYQYADHSLCNAPNYEEAMYWFFNLEKTYVEFPLYPRDTIYLSTEPIDLTEIVNPKGGTFSGEIVSDSIFHPRLAGLGKHLVNYQYTNALDSVITRGHLFHVLPYPMLLDTDIIYITDSINTLVSEITLQGLHDTITASHELNEFNELIDYSNSLFSVSDKNLITALAIPTGKSEMDIGIKTITSVNDTFYHTLSLQIIIPTFSLDDIQHITSDAPQGTYVAKILSDPELGLVHALPDTGMALNNEFFTISNDSIFVAGDLSDFSNSVALINLIGYFPTGTPANEFLEILVDGPSNVEQIASSESITYNVFPNPVSSVLNIVSSGSSDHFRLRIISSNGQVCHDTEYAGSSCSVDVSNFEKGIYIVNISNGKSDTSKTILIK